MADTEEFLNTSGAMILAIMPYLKISPKELYETNRDVFDSTQKYFRNIVTELSEEYDEEIDIDCDIFMKNVLPEFIKLVSYFDLVKQGEWDETLDYSQVYMACFTGLYELVEKISEGEKMMAQSFERLDRSLDMLEATVNSLNKNPPSYQTAINGN